jgi:hypothetical protein
MSMNARCNHVSEKPESCRGENSNLAEFAQMRQKRMGIGAIKTSFGGVRPNDQKGTVLVGMTGAHKNSRFGLVCRLKLWRAPGGAHILP